MGLDRYALIAAGGALGALVRWQVAEAIAIDSFPWHTLVVNVVGCGLLALVSAESIPKPAQRFLATGFCGGLTTFATLSVEFVTLIDDGNLFTALVYVLASVALGLGAFLAVRNVRTAAEVAP